MKAQTETRKALKISNVSTVRRWVTTQGTAGRKTGKATSHPTPNRKSPSQRDNVRTAQENGIKMSSQECFKKTQITDYL